MYCMRFFSARFRLRQMGVFVRFLWVPAHVEEVNVLTKQALKHPNVDMEMSISKFQSQGVNKNCG